MVICFIQPGSLKSYFYGEINTQNIKSCDLTPYVVYITELDFTKPDYMFAHIQLPIPDCGAYTPLRLGLTFAVTNNAKIETGGKRGRKVAV